MSRCQGSKWYVFVATDLVVIFSGFFILLFWQVANKFIKRMSGRQFSSFNAKTDLRFDPVTGSRSSVQIIDEKKCLHSVRLWTSKFISGQHLSGKIIISVGCLFTFVTVGTYIYEVMAYPEYMERCGLIYEGLHLFVIDVICYLFFLIYFIMRFVAAEHKLRFWFGIHSLVDLLTIPCYVIELYLDHMWTGFRFLRAVGFMKFPDLLQHLNILKSATKFRLSQLSSIFICIWIIGAGMTHLLENSEDPWLAQNYTSENVITFGDSMYFTIVTMSTVGYGDIIPHTALGKIWVSLFIMVSFAIFASFIPEIAEILFSGSKYGGKYIKKAEYMHIVVSGHLDFTSVQSFLADFFNEDRPFKKIDVVFLNPNEPDFRLRNLLKKNFMRVKYIKGTVMDQADLKRVSVEDANACFIISNHNCKDPKEEDTANIMRVISLKNFSSNLRVLVQLLQNENKSYLRNIPTWSPENGDTIICYSEVELRILSKSCLVPGFSTFIANLLTIQSDKQCKKFRIPGNSWINEYIEGVGMELYTTSFSPGLQGMQFYDLVLLCFNYLNILLIAVEVKNLDGTPVFINPASQSNVTKEAVGYFICKSFKEAQRVSLYCRFCHGTEGNIIQKLKKIKCKCDNKWLEEPDESSSKKSCMRKPYSILKKSQTETECRSFPFLEFDQCLIESPVEPLNFSNHILLCIFAEENSPAIGLKNFVSPLRSKNLKSKNLRPIVIAGNKTFLSKEWNRLEYFPDVYPVSFNSINKKSLSILRVEDCHICIIISANLCNRDSENTDLHLEDKQVILGTLHVKSIFKNISVATSETDLENKSNRFLITKLFVETNVQFLDQDDEDEPNCPVFLSESFACGNAFTTKMLDCLLGIAYFNPDIIRLIQQLTMGEINCLENLPTDSRSHPNKSVQCQIKVLKLANKKFQDFFINKNKCLYKDLFYHAFTNYHIILLGIYRSIDGVVKKGFFSKKKVVITNPSSNFLVNSEDLVLAIHAKHD